MHLTFIIFFPQLVLLKSSNWFPLLFFIEYICFEFCIRILSLVNKMFYQFLPKEGGYGGITVHINFHVKKRIFVVVLLHYWGEKNVLDSTKCNLLKMLKMLMCLNPCINFSTSTIFDFPWFSKIIFNFLSENNFY